MPRTNTPMAAAPKNKFDELDGVELIKSCCPLLSAYGVKTVTFEYDGYGDSGDFNQSYLHVLPSVQQINEAGALSTVPKAELYERAANTTRVHWDKFQNERTNEKNPVITNKLCQRFFDAVFDLLPGGWEINEGSYGTITIDVASASITVEHNERYTDVRSETYNY
jgi:hypothetical protein